MQIDDLIELAKRVQAQQAEAQTVEVKAAHRGCPSKLRDTLSSFSNQNSGGILLFGLDENEHFAAVGVYDLQDLQKKVTEQCNQMQPPVRARRRRGSGLGCVLGARAPAWSHGLPYHSAYLPHFWIRFAVFARSCGD